MPSLNDYDKNDEDHGSLDDGYTPAQAAATGSAGSTGSATGGPTQAPAQPQQQDSYVPWSSFVSANQDVSNREANKLEGQVQGDVSKAKGELTSAENTFNKGIDSNYASGNIEGLDPLSAKPQTRGDTKGLGPLDADQQAPAQKMGTSGKAKPTGSTAGSTENPWASLTGSSDERALSPVPPKASGLNLIANRPPIGPGSLTSAAAAGNISGQKDLESATGATAWSQLLGDSLHAGQEAKALGSEAGVQGLLQQGANSPMGNTAFDAALINGAGQKGFGQLASQYGGNQLKQGITGAEDQSQGRWAQLQGDLANRKASDAAAAAAPAPAKAQPAPAAGAAAPFIPSANHSDVISDAWRNNFNGQWVTNPDGSKSMVWPDGKGDEGMRVFQANQSYEAARISKNVASGWAQDFGVQPSDAQYVQDHMTASDWDAYQKAARIGPDAVKNWFDAILAKRSK